MKFLALIPWAGYEHKGKEGYINLTKTLFDEFESLSFEPQHFTDAGDRIYLPNQFNGFEQEVRVFAVKRRSLSERW